VHLRSLLLHLFLLSILVLLVGIKSCKNALHLQLTEMERRRA
jgi:hypothetical protein